MTRDEKGPYPVFAKPLLDSVQAGKRYCELALLFYDVLLGFVFI